jgi:hypothetical protein
MLLFDGCLMIDLRVVGGFENLFSNSVCVKTFLWQANHG